jgi:hypothetical protein
VGAERCSRLFHLDGQGDLDVGSGVVVEEQLNFERTAFA